MANGSEKLIKAKKEYLTHLKALGEGDGALSNIAYTALILASLDRPGVSFQKYEHHLKILSLDLKGENVQSNSAQDRAKALISVLHERHDYTGNQEYYDDPQNANLMSVIDNRKGLPVSLGILYMHTARGQGWHIEGLKFPRHFLIRLHGADSARDGQVIIDPFNDGKILEARDLRRIIKSFSSAETDLKPEYYQAVTDREILVRLLDNIKVRCLKVSDLGQAINILSRLVLINPQNLQHHYELGMLLAHVDKFDLAIKRLIHCLDNIEKFEHNDLIEQQIVGMLQDLEKRSQENLGSKVLKLPEKE
jgi:regulator of sirC expression with transglutaminase-like and TPR domain